MSEEQKKDLSIIIVDYNAKKLVFDCLDSIKENVHEIKFEVILVDNASPDKIDEEDLKKYNFVKFISNKQNHGFGNGNNIGVKEANGEYLFLLNPDTIIIDNSIQKMLRCLRNHKEIGALTCLMGPNKKTLQKNFFGKFQSIASVTLRRYNYQKIDLSEEFFYTDIVTGAALMIRRELFDKIGGFDERFFMYLEDDDLCKRLVDSGYKNAVLNTARIIHLEGKSISKNSERKKIYYKSQDLYWQKHNGFFPTLIMKVIRWPYKLIKSNK